MPLSSMPFPKEKLPSFREDALHNADIVKTILDFIVVNDLMDVNEASTMQKSLYAAARTCNAFKEPALDVLWSVIPSLVPLFRLLPGFVVYENIYMLYSTEERGWKRYVDYAKRVRKIIFQNYTPSSPLGHPISPHILTQLFCLRKDSTTTFPGLKVICIPVGVKVDENCILLLPTQYTETITFNEGTSDYTRQLMPSLLTFLPKQAPHLKHLALCGRSNVNLDPVSHHSRLVSLKLSFPLTYLHASFLKRIGSMEKLETLSLHIGTASPISLSPSQPAHAIQRTSAVQFPALQNHELTGHPSIVSRVLDHIQPPRLASITIYEEELPSNSTQTILSWKSIFSSLSCSRSLRSVKILQCAKRSWGHPGYSLSSDTLIALAGVHASAQLESLIIECGSIAISNRDIHALSSALCGLKVLKLPLTTFNLVVSLKSVSSICRNCPNLKSLQLPLRGNNIDKDLAFIRDQKRLLLDSENHSNHPLRELFIDNPLATALTPISRNVVSFARFLNDQFPGLRTMVHPGGINDGWKMVEMIVLALREKEKEVLSRQESR